MVIDYNPKSQPVSRPGSNGVWTLLKAGKVAALFATTFAYYSLRAGFIVDVEPIEGKAEDLKLADRLIKKILSSPRVASASTGGFAGSAGGFTLAAGLFIVAAISGITETDFTSFEALPYYLVTISLFVIGGMFFGGLGGGLLGMIYSSIATPSNVRRHSFAVIVSGLLGGLIGEIAGMIVTVNLFVVIAFVGLALYILAYAGIC